MIYSLVLCLILGLSGAQAAITSTELTSNNSINPEYATLNDTLDLTVVSDLESSVSEIKINDVSISYTTSCNTSCIYEASYDISSHFAVGELSLEIVETSNSGFGEFSTVHETGINYVTSENDIEYYANLAFDSDNSGSNLFATTDDNLTFSIDLLNDAISFTSLTIAGINHTGDVSCSSLGTDLRRCSAEIAASTFNKGKLDFTFVSSAGTIQSDVNNDDDFVELIDLTEIASALSNGELTEVTNQAEFRLSYAVDLNSTFEISSITRNNINLLYEITCDAGNCALVATPFGSGQNIISMNIVYSVLGAEYQRNYDLVNPATPNIVVTPPPSPPDDDSGNDENNNQDEGNSEEGEKTTEPPVEQPLPVFDLKSVPIDSKVAALGKVPVILRLEGSDELIFSELEFKNEETASTEVVINNTKYQVEFTDLPLNTLNNRRYKNRSAKLPEIESISLNKKGRVILKGKRFRNKANLTLVFDDGSYQSVELSKARGGRSKHRVKLDQIPENIKYLVYSHHKFGANYLEIKQEGESE